MIYRFLQRFGNDKHYDRGDANLHEIAGNGSGRCDQVAVEDDFYVSIRMSVTGSAAVFAVGDVFFIISSFLRRYAGMFQPSYT